MTATTLKDRQIGWLLAYREHGDERARELLIRSLEGLAVSCAGRFIGSGVDVEDMRSAAMVGLVEAIDVHDLSRGDNIAGTAWQWCRRRIMELIDSSADAAVSKWSKMDRKIRRNLMPLVAEYETAGASRSQAMILACDDLDVDVSRADAWLAARGSAPIDDVPEVSTDDMPADEMVSRNQAAAVLRDAMSGLDDRERKVLEFKLSGRTPSFDELAEKYGVTRRRVRQICDDAQEHVLFELRRRGVRGMGDLF